MLEVEYILEDWDYVSDTQTKLFDSLNELNLYIEEIPMDIILRSIILLETTEDI